MSATLLLQAGASLAAVVALLLLGGRTMRMRGLGNGADPHALRLAASLALDARRRLHLVNVPGGTLLLLTGGANDAILPWPVPAAPPITPGPAA